MNRQPIPETQPQGNVALRTSGLMLQRMCACGQHTVAGGGCDECRKKRRKLQRRAKDQADPFASLSSLRESPKAMFGTPNTAPRFERDFSLVSLQASRNARHLSSPSLRTQPRLQRAAKDGTGGQSGEISAAPSAPARVNTAPPEPATGPAPGPAAPTPEPATAPERPSSGLLVEDEATDLAAGQMKKTEFLAQLRAAVCATAEAILAGTEHSTDGCPYLEFWFDFYGRQSSSHIERAIHKYAPETARAATASEVIPLITARVRQGVETWARTGEVTGVPEDLSANAPTSAASPGGAGEPASAGAVLPKAREGGARAAEDPAAIQAQLGTGRPLDAGMRARMESAFGQSFSRIRAHTDATATRLSSDLNSRAFTVGEHIAFGTGQYRPGTMIGDALIAHELAHVVQQGDGSASVASKPAGGAQYGALEEDADRSAVGAMLSLWQGSKESLGEISQNALPRLKSGLKLQRCPEDTEEKAKEKAEEAPAPTPEEAPAPTPEEAPAPEERPALTPTNTNRLVPATPSAGCIQTGGTPRTSSSSFEVDYEKTNVNRGEITLRQREDSDKVLHKIDIPERPKIERATIPSGIPISNEDHHYELEMEFFNSRGKRYGGLGGGRPVVKFEVCRLDPAPTGDDLLFAKAIYAEGVDAGEFPHIRDLVFNRIDWVATCPGDAGDFGTDIRTVLNAPNQFASVLNNTSKFQELADELNNHSGACQYTTAPRAGAPARCRLVNAAIQAEAAGDGNTHNNIFLRSDTKTPSTRATNRSRYPGGNYYWEISGCPPDRRRR